MPLNPEAVGTTSAPVEVTWTSKDALLYAVGVGAGTAELAFTTENTAGVPQQVLPTFPVVLGWGRGSVMSTMGTYNPAMLVHGQQAVTLPRPLPTEGTATLTTELVAMYDKGKAAVVVTETRAVADGQPLYTNRSSVFIRGEGGWGGERGPSGPVIPGEVLTVRVWELGDDEAVFTTSVGDRTVIDQGLLRHG